MTSSHYQIEIKKTRDDKILVEIISKYGANRYFDITASKDGLSILGEESLVVRPMATNKLVVDTVS